MHVDGQQVIALGIVAMAALAVGRRLWGQAAAFRSKPGRAGSGGACDGCPSGGASKTPSTSPPLMQIQTKPPVHLRRPPVE